MVIRHHIKRFRKNALTLVEVLIVVLIMGILLSMTMGLGTQYVKTMQVKKDKELMVGHVTDIVGIARTSNYYKGTKYSYVDIGFTSGSITSVLSTADEIDTVVISKSRLVFSWSNFTVRLVPYQMGCTLLEDPTATGYQYEFQSMINTDEYCFLRNLTVCKLQQVTCS